MTYQKTITSKGQITIPKPLRDALRLHKSRRVLLDFDRVKGEIKVKPSEDFFSVAKRINVNIRTDPVKAREYMEKFYERA